jgi:hypothetical protein
MRSAELVEVAQPIACCGKGGGISRRGLVGERGMRPPVVAVVNPGRDLFTGVIEPEKQRLVEQFIARPPVEAFAETILHRLARRDEVPGDRGFLHPRQHSVRGELRAVVGDDQSRLAAPLDQRDQLADHAAARD